MIHVLATVEVKPGHRDAFLAEFHRVVPLVLAEAGCLAYGATIDVDSGLPVQLPPRENVVVIVEQWTDLAALRAHIGAAHMAEYRVRIKDLVVHTKLQVLQPA